MASMEEVPTLRLKKGSAKPLHAGHPWVFAAAVSAIDRNRVPGAEVRVVDDKGQFLGRGFYSPQSAIAVRLITHADVEITPALLEMRILEALRLRREILGLGLPTPAAATSATPGQPAQTSAYRLINSEGDGLGGLIVDVYGEYLAVQIGTAGMERRLDTLLDLLEKHLAPRAIFDRGDKRARKLEGLPPPREAPLRGDPPDGRMIVREHGLAFHCDLRPGHSQKTGLFLDQRENRRRFAQFARGRDVLDVFSYGGAFSLHAARGGARGITLLDASAEALEMARENLGVNGIDDADLVCAEWTEGFRHLREAGRQFGLMAVDPPKFSRAREQAGQALSGYRDLNAQAVRLLAPGGILFTCSCSGTVGETEFERAVAAGIRAAGRRAVLLERRGAAPDHPTPPGFDQGRYLKCLVLQVV